MEASTQISTDVFTCTTLAVAVGKGTNAAKRVIQAVKNEAYLGVLLAEGVARKAIIEKLTEADIKAFIDAVASGKYARPMATLVAIAEKAFTYTATNGDVPRSDWMRLGAELKGLTSKKGAKAHALWVKVQAEADRIFEARKGARAALGN